MNPDSAFYRNFGSLRVVSPPAESVLPAILLIVGLLVAIFVFFARRKQMSRLYSEAQYHYQGLMGLMPVRSMQEATADYDAAAFRYNVVRELPLSRIVARDWPMLGWASQAFSGGTASGDQSAEAQAAVQDPAGDAGAVAAVVPQQEIPADAIAYTIVVGPDGMPLVQAVDPAQWAVAPEAAPPTVGGPIPPQSAYWSVVSAPPPPRSEPVYARSAFMGNAEPRDEPVEAQAPAEAGATQVTGVAPQIGLGT